LLVELVCGPWSGAEMVENGFVFVFFT
jgi:hypothetical protein